MFQSDVHSRDLFSKAPFDSILPHEEAFQLNINVNAERITLIFKIKDDYYIYRDSVLLTHDGERLDFIFRETDWRITNDQFLGTQEVAFKKIELEINKSNIDGHNTFEISYQGCSEGKYCYPVVKKEIKI
ncbi:protein-disulfide reductase DsbD family protein [Gammaproteobacteria bacterium]|nr:protein-disulfide reductase DsbD family protein [Gammaproteobacteria bacterium]